MKDQASATLRTDQPAQEDTATALEKQDWEDPELSFVEPKLTKHGELQELTGGFFGSFQP